MRNERWVNRFLFAWNDTLFFDPLDVHYVPRADHFLAGFDERIRARFVRSGIWWSHRHDPELPAQGWKIHVSADHRSVREVATAVIGHLTEHGHDFKIALDLNIFEMLNSKGMSRGSAGKLVTVYPRDEERFRLCLAELGRLLAGTEGAYVLSDQRYRHHRSLYFRYGQFLDTHTVDVLGRRVPYITGPDGAPVPDDRRPGAARPWWVAWPFTDWKPDASDEGPEEDLLGGRFRVTGAIQFSNSGGVYTAEDTANGDRKVVLKEARPHTNPNPRQDHDAVGILAREWTFLNRLAGTGAFPAPIAHFTHWEHHFIAEEFIDGSDIRAVLLERNPLARPGYDLHAAKDFLRIFVTVFRSLARAVKAAHQRHVVLGDLTAANLLIDPATYEVTIVDLEACRLADDAYAEAEGAADAEDGRDRDTGTDGPGGGEGLGGLGGLDRPVELFTPGFSLSRHTYEAFGFEGDLFALATTMAYFVFPVAAMSYLRENVLDGYRLYFDGLGWPPRLHRLILDLAGARISLGDVVDALADEEGLIAEVRQPAPRPGDPAALAAAEAGVAAFVTAVADPERATLFPADPFTHVTNPLSLGFGASGVLWALNASGIAVRPEWREWLRERLAGIDHRAYPDGLMSGLAGIAWAADTLGLRTEAAELLALANRRALTAAPGTGTGNGSGDNSGDGSGTPSPTGLDHTFYYGLAGLGMTNLRFHLHTEDPRHLAAARACADRLHATARRDDDGAYWLNSFSGSGPLTGLGFGQAGVALFLLRMHQITGEAGHLRLGRAALGWEMAHARPLDDLGGPLMFEHEGTMEPYVEVGSAGTARVLLRYGALDDAREVLRGLDIGHSVLPGYSYGMSGIADTLLDAAELTRDRSYRDIALRQLDYVRRVFLFEPAARFRVPRDPAGAAPLGVPGEGLLRCATDYLTGSAGVLRALHRARTGGGADFLLDEVER
ncbi:lanthionine synthetase LanC family protein [Streptomyces sp. NPDC090025]|uniref:class III lanthionine synthetase LanKC N-terminal domain-containing protein n=1 Tax=Streptomyces sp. NPDC090025 TaxID=3365922 RepID=UPI0038342B79